MLADPGLELIDPPGIYRPVTYAHACKTGQTIYVAGQVARGPQGQLLCPDDAAGQSEQVYANLRAVLSAAGTDLRHVVKVTTYLTHASDSAAVTQARLRAFGDHRPPHTGLIVAGLGSPEVRVEVEVIAVVP